MTTLKIKIKSIKLQKVVGKEVQFLNIFFLLYIKKKKNHLT